MLISRAPVRITLGGGGTDLPSYYEKYGGYLISGAINKHVYVSANKQFYNNYFLKYSKLETKEDVNKIEHNLIRESIKLLNIGPGIEITSMADIPSGTGLGSSGAFLVALLNTLHHYKGENPTKRQLAEEACKIELDILKEHEGKQDKFVSAFAGIKAYEFYQGGRVSVIPLSNEDIVISTLREKLFLFFTGQKRIGKASDALKIQDEKVKTNDADMIDRLHLIKKIGIRTKEVFDSLDFDTFGSLLDQHWEIKKQYSPASTSPFMDNCYKVAKDNGVLGGKICCIKGTKISLPHEKNTNLCACGCEQFVIKGNKYVNGHNYKNRLKNIENIKIGDKVVSYNIQKKELEEDDVVEVFERVTRDLVTLKFSDGGVICITPEHPIFVVGRKDEKQWIPNWVVSDKIKDGDEVLKFYPKGCCRKGQHFSMLTEFQKGQSFSKETEIKKGQHLSIKTELKKGEKPWNIDLTKETDERVLDYAKKISLTVSELHKLENTPYNKEWSKKKSIPMKESWNNVDIRNSRIKGMRKYWDDPEKKRKHILSLLSIRSPTKLEIDFEKFLDDYFPNEFCFNGNGKQGISIGLKIPDFVNIEKKKVIETLGDFWHGNEWTGRTKEEEEIYLINHYEKFGWECLLIWENEIKNFDLIRTKVIKYIYNTKVDVIKVCEVVKEKRSTKVYNFRTKKNNNYFADGILTHNCGAGGGGGFFMFYHPGEPKDIWKFVSEMEKLGLHQMKYDFDTEGAIVVSRECEL